MKRRKFLQAAGASTAAALSGCMGLDSLYGSHVAGNIESDIEGLTPEETAEYFMNEQRSFDEIDDKEGLMSDQVHVSYEEEDGEYDVQVTMPTNLNTVDDHEDAERYEEVTGENFHEEMVGPAPEDSLFFMEGDDEVYHATSTEEVLRDLSYHLVEGAELPYRVFEGEGTDRPVARGQFIENGSVLESVDAEPGTFEVRLLTDDGMIKTSYEEDDLEEMLDHRQEITTSDMEFVEDNWEII